MLGELLCLLRDAVIFAFLLAVVVTAAHAETAAEKVFGRWQKVTIEQIAEPVPEWRYSESRLGSITTEYRRRAYTVEEKTALRDFPNVSPRSVTPEQVPVLKSHSLERR